MMAFIRKPLLFDVHLTRRQGNVLLRILLLAGVIWLTVTLIRVERNFKNAATSISWLFYKAKNNDTERLLPEANAMAMDEKQRLQNNVIKMDDGEKQLLRIDDGLKEHDPWLLFNNESDRSNQPNDDMEVGRGVKRYGENGEAVVLPSPLPTDIQKQVDEAKKIFGLNQYVSDLVSVRRELPDTRDERCKAPGKYSESLPRTSVIIIFHNEAYSVLLRTVHSVLNRSPERLIEEIILVDDFSDMLCLKLQLEEYMARYPKVKILRTTKREGLIRARVIGAKYAIGPVLSFFDSHCECTVGWLEPLLDRIRLNKNTVAAPMIDGIGIDTFAYNKWENYYVGFTWSLDLLWHFGGGDIKPDSIEPIRSPAMVGGEFSIDKEFFKTIGTYDTELDTWGSENFELSFKTWMCGGVIENLPCSRVAHNYRWKPYKFDHHLLLRNNARLAKVWMDDYAKFYFEWRASDMNLSGDVSSRIELRKRLECKSFKWYLENVIPSLRVPSEAISHGEVRNLAYDAQYCLDRYKEVPIVWSCHDNGNYNQFWVLSKTNEIRATGQCIDNNSGKLSMKECENSKGNQEWIYKPKDKLIQHGAAGKCLAMSENKNDLVLEVCDKGVQRQLWIIESYNVSATAIGTDATL